MPEWLLQILDWKEEQGRRIATSVKFDDILDAIEMMKITAENGAGKFRLTRGDKVDDPEMKAFLGGDNDEQ